MSNFIKELADEIELLHRKLNIVTEWYLQTRENYDGMLTREDLEVEFDRHMKEALEDK